MSIRLPVLSEPDFEFRFWEKFSCLEEATELLRRGIIEEVYDHLGNFKGIIKPERPYTPSERFHRSSLIDSERSLTLRDSLGNIGALSEAANRRAVDRVYAWPMVHDDLAVVISAGRVYGASPA